MMHDMICCFQEAGSIIGKVGTVALSLPRQSGPALIDVPSLLVVHSCIGVY